MFRYWITGTASAALLACSSLSANAAPAVGMTLIRPAAEQTSTVDQIAYRNCRWRDGVRYCGQRGSRAYLYEYERPRPEAFETGSTAWWRAMDYEGRGGHGRTR